VTQTRTPADLTVTPRGEHPRPTQLIMIKQNSLGVAALSYLALDGTAAVPRTGERDPGSHQPGERCLTRHQNPSSQGSTLTTFD
jgi:hypothetical protein